MTTISLDIQGMSCNHCVMRVQRALAAVPGVENAQVTLQPARARVAFDEAAATAQVLTDAVAKAGYSASVAGQ
jgi:copper ion binding protein